MISEMMIVFNYVIKYRKKQNTCFFNGYSPNNSGTRSLLGWILISIQQIHMVILWHHGNALTVGKIKQEEDNNNRDIHSKETNRKIVEHQLKMVYELAFMIKEEIETFWEAIA